MRKLYSAVRLFFIASLLAAIGSTVSSIDSLSAIGGLMVLVGGVMTMVSLCWLRHENRRFAKAVRAVWIYIGIAIVAVAAIIAMVSWVGVEGADMVLFLAPTVLCIGLLVTILRLQYFTYTGFEEVRETRGIDYPPRRIMWCFYLTILGLVIMFVSVIGTGAMAVGALVNGSEAAVYATAAAVGMMSILLAVTSVAIGVIHLWLMFTYMQAVRAAEENEARERRNSMR